MHAELDATPAWLVPGSLIWSARAAPGAWTGCRGSLWLKWGAPFAAIRAPSITVGNGIMGWLKPPEAIAMPTPIPMFIMPTGIPIPIDCMYCWTPGNIMGAMLQDLDIICNTNATRKLNYHTAQALDPPRPDWLTRK